MKSEPISEEIDIKIEPFESIFIEERSTLECNNQDCDNPKEPSNKIENFSLEKIDQRFVQTEIEAELKTEIETALETEIKTEIKTEIDDFLFVNVNSVKSEPKFSVQDYKHITTGDIITLTPSFRFIGLGRKSEKMKELLANQSLEDLVQKGVLKRHRNKRKIPTNNMKTIKNSSKSLHIYKHKITKDVVILNSEFEVHSSKNERIKSLLKSKENIMALIQNGTLVKKWIQRIHTPFSQVGSEPGFFVQDFKHISTGEIITMLVPKVQKTFSTQNWKELVEKGILVKHGTNRKIPSEED